MDLALREAEDAFARGDWPVGSVLVRDGVVLATGQNRQNTERDVTWHAEFEAMRRVTRDHGLEKLAGATVYSTMEPCPMCAGALVNARVRRLYFGCDDPKAGAVRTLFNLTEDSRLNHRVEVFPGVLAAEGAALLRGFFSRLRQPEGRDRG